MYANSQTNDELLEELEKYLEKFPENPEAQLNIDFLNFKSEIENYITKEDIKNLKKIRLLMML